MWLTGQIRLIQFWIASTAGVPITTCTLDSFTITFTRNGIICTDSLSLVNNGAGSYSLQYTPSTAGQDVITIDYSVNGLHYCDIGTISADFSSSAILLTQNIPTSNALMVTVPNPSSYTLYVYNSSDWASGNTDTFYALDSTQLDSYGNWLTTPIYVIPGTYHIVIRDNTGTVTVLMPYLQV
jgi:hypothetical protein